MCPPYLAKTQLCFSMETAKQGLTWVRTQVWLLSEFRITHRKQSAMIKPVLYRHQGSATADNAPACQVQAAERALSYLWQLSTRKLYRLHVHNVSHTYSELQLSRTRAEVLLAGGEAQAGPVMFPFIEDMQPQSVSQPASQISWRGFLHKQNSPRACPTTPGSREISVAAEQPPPALLIAIYLKTSVSPQLIILKHRRPRGHDKKISIV